jgi:hypothetical protein
MAELPTKAQTVEFLQGQGYNAEESDGYIVVYGGRDDALFVRFIFDDPGERPWGSDLTAQWGRRTPDSGYTANASKGFAYKVEAALNWWMESLGYRTGGRYDEHEAPFEVPPISRN